MYKTENSINDLGSQSIFYRERATFKRNATKFLMLKKGGTRWHFDASCTGNYRSAGLVFT